MAKRKKTDSRKPGPAEIQTLARLSDRVLGYAEQLLPPTCPIYEANARGDPDLVGSSVLLRVADESFLLTAGHVMDRRRNTTLYVGGEPRMVELSGEYRTTRVPGSNSRKADRTDLGVLPLSDAQVSGLGSVGLVELRDLDPEEVVDPTPVTGTRYIVSGFPVSKQSRLATSELKAKSVWLPLVPQDVREYQPGLDERHHIVLEFDRTNMVGPTGTVTAPDPHGMSGGPVWSVDLYGLGRVPDRPRLVGIGIEYHKAPINTIVCARIGLCIDAISDLRPALRSLLPQPTRWVD